MIKPAGCCSRLSFTPFTGIINNYTFLPPPKINVAVENNGNLL